MFMSTNNFSYRNICVVLPDFKFDNRCMEENCEYFESEGNNCEHVDDYYEFDTEGFKMFKKEVQDKLVKIGFEPCDRSESNSNRNYEGDVIADWTIYDRNDNRKDIEVVIRNGYYDGMNFDYNVSDDGCYEETKAMAKKVASQIKKLEKVLIGCGEHIIRVATMSNGEAIYKKVK
jgi:hypothetical protein